MFGLISIKVLSGVAKAIPRGDWRKSRVHYIGDNDARKIKEFMILLI